jgi:hypothetical protein
VKRVWGTPTSMTFKYRLGSRMISKDRLWRLTIIGHDYITGAYNVQFENDGLGGLPQFKSIVVIEDCYELYSNGVDLFMECLA